jgi:hypothetical protein
MMSRPQHGRRRRRPGRRLRYRGNGLPPRSGFQAHGLKAVYDLLLPHVRGRDRRLFFNDVSFGVALLFGVLGAVLGCSVLGPFGLFIGLGAGMSYGANFLVKNRYYRP